MLGEPEPEAPAEVTRSSLALADAIAWAIANLNRHVSPPGAKLRKGDVRAPTDTHYTYWKFGQEDSKALVERLGKHAIAIIDKATGDDTEDADTIAEGLAVQEIDELISAAIEEASTT